MTNMQFLAIQTVLYVIVINGWRTDLPLSVMAFRFLLVIAAGVFAGLALRGS